MLVDLLIGWYVDQLFAAWLILFCSSVYLSVILVIDCFFSVLHIAAKLVCILVGNWACLRVCWLLGYQLAGMMACELVAWVIGGPVLYLCDALFAW